MNIIFSIYFKDEKTGEDLPFNFIDRNTNEIIENLENYLKDFGTILNINIISEFGMIYFKVNMNALEKKCSLLERQSPIFNIENRSITFLPPFLYEEIDDEKIEEVIEFSDYESEYFDLTTKKPYSLWFTRPFNKPIHFYTHTYLDCKKDCCHIKVLDKNVNINKIRVSRPFYNHDIIGLELLDNLKELAFDVSTFRYPSVNHLKLDKLIVGYLFTETITCPIKTIIFCDMYMCTDEHEKQFNFISNLFANYPSQFIKKTSDIFNRVNITKFVRILKEDYMYINDDIKFDLIYAIEKFIYFIVKKSNMHEDKKIEYIKEMLGVVNGNIEHSKKFAKMNKTFNKKYTELLKSIDSNLPTDILRIISEYR
jgi:hypothetical protein